MRTWPLLLLLACAAPAPRDGGPGDGADPSGVEEPTAPDVPVLAPSSLPRLTAVQHRQALVDLLGEPLPGTPLQADTDPFLFTRVGATLDAFTELGVQRLEEAADTSTAAVFQQPSRRLALVGCEPARADDACARAFVARFGRRAWRRPLTADEVDRYVALAVELSQPDVWAGLGAMVAAMLQAPEFVYRVELGEPDPDDPTRWRYTGFEMASRLSFLLWDTLPDEALLDAAAAGTLHTHEGVVAQARRLVRDPRARPAVARFFEQYLQLDELASVDRDADAHPHWTPALADAMATEVRLLVDDLVWRQGADARSLFSTDVTWVNSTLAEHYGLDAPGASPIAYVPVTLPEHGPRKGLLTLGAFLVLNAHEVDTAPTLRGAFLRERVLCTPVPPPPPDVSTEIPPPEPGLNQTLRERLDAHRTDPACASCHAFIDPPGFLFEGFDATGKVRTHDNGSPVDTTGEIFDVPLDSARDLADLLAGRDEVGRCMVVQLFRHTHGRVNTRHDNDAIDRMARVFAAAGHDFRALLVAMVADDTFRFLAPGESP